MGAGQPQVLFRWHAVRRAAARLAFPDGRRVGALCTTAAVVLAVAALLLLLASELMCLGVTMDTVRLIRAFDYDENNLIGMVLRNLQHGNLDPKSTLYPHGFYDYGQVYQSVAYGLIRLFERLGFGRTVYLIAFTLRFVSFAAAVLAGLLMYRVQRRLGTPATIALLAAIALVGSPNFSESSVWIHPDVLQATAIFAAMACLLGRYSFWRGFAAAAIAGAAFGVKYGGIFVLPALTAWIALGELSRSVETQATSTRVVFRIALLLMGALAVFSAAWMITNPYVLSDWRVLLHTVEWRHRHVERGHFGAESSSPFAWFGVFSGDFSIVGVALFVAGIALAGQWLLIRGSTSRGTRGARFRNFSRSPRRCYVTVLALFCATTFGFLVEDVHMRRMRYTFVVLPVAIALSAFGIGRGVSKLRRVEWRGLLLSALSALIVLMVVTTVRANATVANRWFDPRIAVGDWLADNYPPETTILADEYSYIPVRFAKPRFEMGIDKSDVQKRHARLVVLSEEANGRFCWKRPGTRFAELQLVCSGLDGVKSYRGFQSWLASPASGYVVVHEESCCVVLEHREAPPPVPEPDPNDVSHEN